MLVSPLMSGLERIPDIRFRYVKNFLNGDFRPQPDLRQALGADKENSSCSMIASKESPDPFAEIVLDVPHYVYFGPPCLMRRLYFRHNSRVDD